MPTIQVRNVPDDVHRTLKARAGRAGMSLQEYLLSRLESEARSLTSAELVERVEEQRRLRREDGYSDVSSAALVRADRARS